MTDMTDRLETLARWLDEIVGSASNAEIAREAATLIVSLREGLKPFAEVADEADKFGTVENDHFQIGFGLTFGNVRTARLLLKPAETEGKSDAATALVREFNRWTPPQK